METNVHESWPSTTHNVQCAICLQPEQSGLPSLASLAVCGSYRKWKATVLKGFDLYIYVKSTMLGGYCHHHQHNGRNNNKEKKNKRQKRRPRQFPRQHRHHHYV